MWDNAEIAALCGMERVMSGSKEVPLSCELDGVIADYEHDKRFDEISLATVQRVRDALARMESEEPVIWNHPPARQAMRGVCPEIPGDILDHPPAASADAEDAARYRWLRCGGWEVMQDAKYWRPELRFDGAIDAARVAIAIDAAIDAARAKGGNR